MKNKYIIKIICGLIGIVSLLSFCACDGVPAQVEAKANDGFSLYMTTIDEGRVGTFCYYKVLEDKRTKVEYLVIFNGYSNGGFTITPLYDTDGSLYKEALNGN